MNHSSLHAQNRVRPGRFAARWSRWLLLVPLLAGIGHAELPEPNNLIYGTIVIDTDVIRATRTDVVVEARRLPGGPAIASYRMGEDPSAGDFYRLRIPMEALGPGADENASFAGDTLFIVLIDGAGVQGQGSYTIPERGATARVNFGAAVSDIDGNGLPDAWELAWFGAGGQDPDADPDGDRRSTRDEWIAGTHPLDGADHFALSVSNVGGQTEVSFVALRAEGPGYAGKSRVYSLLSRTNLNQSGWEGVSPLTNVFGNNQVIRHQPANGGEAGFFRGSVSLRDQ